MRSEYTDIAVLAKMSQIALTQDETKHLSKELQSILQYVTTLGQVDTSSVAPTNQVNDLRNQTRQDKVEPSQNAEALQRLSPRRSGFRIPSVRSLWTSGK